VIFQRAKRSGFVSAAILGCVCVAGCGGSSGGAKAGASNGWTTKDATTLKKDLGAEQTELSTTLPASKRAEFAKDFTSYVTCAVTYIEANATPKNALNAKWSPPKAFTTKLKACAAPVEAEYKKLAG
jgi:hypothetical protein